MNIDHEREEGDMEVCDRYSRMLVPTFCYKQTSGVDKCCSCRTYRKYVLQNMEFSFKTIVSVILLTLLLSPVDVECRAGAYKSAEQFYAERGDQMVVSEGFELLYTYINI
jgi:hypothetical protein